MSTRTKPELAVDATTPVASMPPLTVTTEGIPATEHVETAPPVRAREERTRWYALAFMGVLSIVAVLALIANALFYVPQPAPVTAPTVFAGWGELGSTMSEWPPRTTPVTPTTFAGWGELGSTMSEWPPRTAPSTDGYSQWGSMVSEWPPRPSTGWIDASPLWPQTS